MNDLVSDVLQITRYLDPPTPNYPPLLKRTTNHPDVAPDAWVEAEQIPSSQRFDLKRGPRLKESAKVGCATPDLFDIRGDFLAGIGRLLGFGHLRRTLSHRLTIRLVRLLILGKPNHWERFGSLRDLFRGEL